MLEKFTFYGRATFTSTDRSMVAGTDVADIAYVFCTEHRRAIEWLSHGRSRTIYVRA